MTNKIRIFFVAGPALWVFKISQPTHLAVDKTGWTRRIDNRSGLQS